MEMSLKDVKEWGLKITRNGRRQLGLFEAVGLERWMKQRMARDENGAGVGR
jgi:hypothetical protein